MLERDSQNQGLRLDTREAHAPRGYVHVPPYATTSEQQEMEDARRRFILALRVLTVRKESNSKAEAMLSQWRTELEEEIAAIRKKRRANVPRKIVRSSILLLFFVSWLFGRHYFHSWMWVIFFMAGAAEVAVSQKRKETTTALARARDPRAVGVLAKAARDGDPATKEAASKGLLSILPSLRASDRQFVDAEAMAALIALLAWGEGLSAGTNSADVDMKLSILRAMEQIGDARAIPAVRKLLNPPRVAGVVLGVLDRSFHIGTQTKIEAVRQAAKDCLPYLEQRAAAERMRDRLLRPASAPTQSSDLLLRPAGNTPNTPEELLLRPVEGAEG